MILVDSNVAIDVLDANSEHHRWSMERYEQAAVDGYFVNHIVVAEIATRAASVDQLGKMMDLLAIPVDPFDDAIAFRAGQAFLAWIKNGGRRGAMLPDLLIGAHAAVRGAKVLTRDARRYRTYFPEVSLITPESNHD